ncbi:UDP-glucose 4-epimerase GalE [Marinigracilibium pacificum]|uniref:UDP-glucose 4-epimerase n=1 Tax=Marinigracilibium pacificum TaxID=2729599 RepID=A0A848J268_9BACT|nr:UDP-glucose 4-epimerase GalE [Marinigracilibium pacificum]NMM49811.1 UDP-glucose 4-epimerase GalE [Marinigracilibium pacificum]
MPDKILVTGGAGYIGSHTVVELRKAGYIPVIIDNFSNSDPAVISQLEKITGEPTIFYALDCNNTENLKKVFRENPEITGVIHFAAFKAVGESVAEPIKYYHNNIGSLVTLIQSMEEFKVSNLVFSSSCTVYGQPDKLPVKENSPKKQAESPYGNTKAICEEILSDANNAGIPIKSIALRYFNPIGAHPSSLIGELPKGVPNNLVPFVTQTAAGWRKELTIFGKDYNTVDGTCVRDYIHVVDLAKAHVKALKHLEKISEFNNHFEALNIGTGNGNSVKEVVDTFQKVNEVKLNYTFGPRRAGDVEQVYADASTSEDVLGWKAELSLEDALKDAWNWQKTLKKPE